MTMLWVTAISSLLFYVLYPYNKVWNIELTSLVMSLFSSISTHILLYNDPYFYFNIYMYDTNEVAYISYVTYMYYGYSIFEILIYLNHEKRMDFLIHGISLFIMMTHMHCIGHMGSIFPILISQTSSVFLSIRRLKYMDIAFVISYLIYKCIFVPCVVFYSILDVRNPLRLYIAIYYIPFFFLTVYWAYLITKKIDLKKWK